jgi:hypothetical protein
MSTDTMLTIKDFQDGIKMGKAGAQKKPGLMKSTAGFFDMLSTYVDRIANAKDEGKLVATHGTQQPLEIFEAMDIRGVFNEFWGGVEISSGWNPSPRPSPSRPRPARPGRCAPSSATWTA